MDSLQKYILNEIKDKRLDAKKGKQLLMEASHRVAATDDIAIIGMGMRMPQADNKDEFWENLSCKIISIRNYPKERHDLTDAWLPEGIESASAYQKQAYLKHIELFDEKFFGISPTEACQMDPIQRIFMECSYEALEDAGYGGNKLAGTKTAVYVGASELGQPRYGDFLDKKDGSSFLGNANSIIPARLSYYLGLEGASMVVDSACSSGLLGVDLACESLKSKQSDLAVVCGATINLMPVNTDRVTILESPDSRIHPFGDEANGTVWGEGVGVVILKRYQKALSDSDRIYAVIRGNGSNNSGNSNGITAPKMQLQQALFEEVWKKNHINVNAVKYVEAHGTGTELGDPIEIKSLTNAFAKFTSKKQFCAIGNAKAGIGHLVAASGIAALIKSALSLYHGEVSPMRGFKVPNRYINFCNTPFYISDEKITLDSNNSDELILVNSFSISGTNVHLVVGKSPNQKKQIAEKFEDNKEYLLLLSAKSKYSLSQLTGKYIEYFPKTKASMADICYSSWKGRGHYSIRAAVIASSIQEMLDKLRLLQSGKDQTLLNVQNIELIDLAEKYLNGETISCEQLYSQNNHFVDIPVYVFDEHKRWPNAVKS